MTNDEAIDEVAYLKGLFPMTTETRMNFWLETFVSRPRDPVHRGIKRFAEKHGDNVDPAGLITLIDEEMRREFKPENPQVERARVDEDWRKVDAAVRALPAAELERLQAEAIESLPERLREAARRRGISSPIVQARIYKAITPANAV